MTRKEWRDYPPARMGEEDAAPESSGYMWFFIGVLIGSGLMSVMLLAESLGAITANWFSGGYP